MTDVSFVIPAFNCAGTIEHAVMSIVEGNLGESDEIVVTDDASTDRTGEILRQLSRRLGRSLRVVTHSTNQGGGAARNSAVRATRGEYLFCLDSDNLLEPGSVSRLTAFLRDTGADAAAFEYVRFFRKSPRRVTHYWKYRLGVLSLADCLAAFVVPPSSGNYLYTRSSWDRAGGYPCDAGELDAWGFGFRQVASGCKILVLPEAGYFHRWGHDSYWAREGQRGGRSRRAFAILTPFEALLDPADFAYIQTEARDSWFDDMPARPIRGRDGSVGRGGQVVWCDGPVGKLRRAWGESLARQGILTLAGRLRRV